MQDHAEEATVNRQPAITSIFDKTKRPELVHEMTDPRSRGADHLCQVFLIDFRMHDFGPALLAKISQQQENPSQALLTGVEELVDEIPFESNVA